MLPALLCTAVIGSAIKFSSAVCMTLSGCICGDYRLFLIGFWPVQLRNAEQRSVLDRVSMQIRPQLAITISPAAQTCTIVGNYCYYSSALCGSTMSATIEASAPIVAKEGSLARVHTLRPGDDRNLEVRGRAVDLSKKLPSGKYGARWIHVPANDLDWVNVCITDNPT